MAQGDPNIEGAITILVDLLTANSFTMTRSPYENNMRGLVDALIDLKEGFPAFAPLQVGFNATAFEAVADGVISFFDRRKELHTNGISFGQNISLNSDPYKVSTDISLVSIDRSDPEAFPISEVITRGFYAGPKKYLEDWPVENECYPEQSLFLNPIF